MISDQALVDAYEHDANLQGMAPTTLRDYIWCLWNFIDFLQKSPLKLKQQDLTAFLEYLKDDRELSISTISKYFSALSSFYEFLEYEEHVKKNLVPAFRKRYVHRLTKRLKQSGSRRQLITVKQARTLIHSILSPRDRAVNVLLAKTGIRRAELVTIDLDDVNWEEMSIELKPKAKRTNLTIFFDDETNRVMQRWLKVRKGWRKVDADAERALFLSQRGTRLARSGVYNMVVKYARRAGLHDPESKELRKRFTTHCYRHFMTTHLLRNGMPREYIQELRGDSRHEAIDIYHHIDPSELRQAYLEAVPQLGL